MRGDGLAGPVGTGLSGGDIADGDHEFESGRIGRGEFIPGFGAERTDVIIEPLQQIEGVRIDRDLGVFGGLVPFIATLTGWFTAEVGRQPWTVYGVLRTADAMTPFLTTRTPPGPWAAANRRPAMKVRAKRLMDLGPVRSPDASF